jgi:multidrug efflux pump subunit AcrA (membrane-fusion protein)
VETLLVAFLTALLFFSLVFAFSSGGETGPEETATAPTIIQVGLGDVTSSVTQAGKVVSDGTAFVSPKSQSRLTNLFVKVGTRVAEGALLATVDNTVETQSLAQSKVALNVAVSQLANSLANVQALQDAATANTLAYRNAVNNALRNLESTKAQVAIKSKNYQNAVDQAQVNFNQAQSIYNSSVQFFATLNINITMCQSYNTVNSSCTELMQHYVNYQNSQITLDTARQNQTINQQSDEIQVANLSATHQSAILQQTTGLQKDQQAIAAAQRAYATLATQYGVSKPNPAPEDFVLAQLAITSAQLALDATFIRAPISGVVTAISAAIGQNSPDGAAAGGQIGSLFTITSDGTFQVVCDFNLDDGAKLRTGAIATVTFSELTKPVRAAKIISIQKMLPNQDTPPSYRATIQITGQKSDIYPGLAGTVEVAIRGVSKVLIVPNLAIIAKADKNYVKKIDATDGKPVLTQVVLGVVGKSTSQVISGLSLGDSIELQKEETPIENGAQTP